MTTTPTAVRWRIGLTVACLAMSATAAVVRPDDGPGQQLRFILSLLYPNKR